MLEYLLEIFYLCFSLPFNFMAYLIWKDYVNIAKFINIFFSILSILRNPFSILWDLISKDINFLCTLWLMFSVLYKVLFISIYHLVDVIAFEVVRYWVEEMSEGNLKSQPKGSSFYIFSWISWNLLHIGAEVTIPPTPLTFPLPFSFFGIDVLFSLLFQLSFDKYKIYLLSFQWGR